MELKEEPIRGKLTFSEPFLKYHTGWHSLDLLSDLSDPSICGANF